MRILGKPRSLFHVCGYAGVLAAVVLAITLAGHTGLSYFVLGAIVVSAILTFLALVALTKIITGEEQIIYYHHEIAVMLTAAVIAEGLHGPVLPYLDVTIVGIGAFLACGRVGCLLVGCCHGRPFPWGIRYRDEHTEEGFAGYLVGMTLFPIQALESLWVLLVTGVGVTMIWSGQAPGTTLAWYTIAYGAARFSFEFIRGDTDRPYTLGFSQGQWLSLWLMSAVVVAEWSGRMPLRAWHATAPVGLLAMMVAVTVHRRLDRSQRFRILHPHHVREVAAVMSAAPEPLSAITSRGSAVRVDCTSLGIQISHGRADDSAHPAEHYTLSQRKRAMTRRTALLLADLIVGLRRESQPGQLAPGHHGVFHLMLLPYERGNGKLHA